MGKAFRYLSPPLQPQTGWPGPGRLHLGEMRFPPLLPLLLLLLLLSAAGGSPVPWGRLAKRLLRPSSSGPSPKVVPLPVERTAIRDSDVPSFEKGISWVTQQVKNTQAMVIVCGLITNHPGVVIVTALYGIARLVASERRENLLVRQHEEQMKKVDVRRTRSGGAKITKSINSVNRLRRSDTTRPRPVRRTLRNNSLTR